MSGRQYGGSSASGLSSGLPAHSPTCRLFMAVSTLSPPPAAHGTALGLVPHWIGGRQVDGSGPRLTVFDPATGTATREIALASAGEVGAAVASAQAAWRAWAETPPVRRARVLARFLALLNERRDA